MAADISYDSVLEESDELSIMCEDDQVVYNRLSERCEREVGRADALIAELAEFGIKAERIIGQINACTEQYRAMHNSLAGLAFDTRAQAEAVTKAKALLEAGQGVYADIAQDMEEVADREFYLSDQVDTEDLAADTETYETRGVA
ncbi:hypothetical protein [Streptacidiphilus anmyonensis]|uniref:hypothetical protein n=1 Tax=Streptacidiphilus anmyonensis TaxID=405782 RepID=UPI0005A723B7|nr:hypothetical protein [Streptacidiphilus anmyonensis]